MLALRVQDITKALRKQEKEYCIKRKELEGEDEPSLAKGAASHEDLMNDAERTEFEGMEQIAMSRDEEINNLVRSINDLAVIFKELSVLVMDQGNILDRIDYNIEQAVRHTKKANVELRKVLYCAAIALIERGESDVEDQVVHNVPDSVDTDHAGPSHNQAHLISQIISWCDSCRELNRIRAN